MAFDGIVARAITSEFKQDITGGKIDKIHQPDKNTIILGVYASGKHLAINICIDAHNCRINLTTHSRINPLVAPNFCMLLRKHLIGGRISDISMISLERLVNIKIETINEFNEIEVKTLVVELMGKHSNIILVNEKNIIIDAMRHIYASSDNYRDILPSRFYSMPTSDKFDFTKLQNFEDFYDKITPELFKIINSGKELQNNDIADKSDALAKIISNTFTGFSLSFVKASIKHCYISESVSEKEIYKINSKEYLSRLYEYIVNIINQTQKLTFEKIYKKDKISDYVLVLGNSEHGSYYLNYFIDDFYIERESTETFTNYRNNILKLILDLLKKYHNRLISINSKLKDCDEMDKYKLYGELITANLYHLTNTHADNIKLENYYDNNAIITIPLDKKYSPSENAKRYFKKYNKLKNAFQIVSKQKIETEQELNYIESIVYELENATTLEDVQEIFEEISDNVIFKSNLKKNQKNKENKKVYKKKKREDTYSPIKYEVDGFTVFAGRNNKENDWLTLSFADKSDIWFHTKDIQGSHVILRTNHQEIPDDTLVKCAKIAAKHSKAKISSNVPVDYCKVQFVKKPNGAKPGMVIFTNNKTLYVNP